MIRPNVRYYYHDSAVFVVKLGSAKLMRRAASYEVCFVAARFPELGIDLVIKYWRMDGSHFLNSMKRISEEKARELEPKLVERALRTWYTF